MYQDLAISFVEFVDALQGGSMGPAACLQPNHPRRGPAILLYYGPALMQKARLFHFTSDPAACSPVSFECVPEYGAPIIPKGYLQDFTGI